MYSQPLSYLFSKQQYLFLTPLLASHIFQRGRSSYFKRFSSRIFSARVVISHSWHANCNLQKSCLFVIKLILFDLQYPCFAFRSTILEGNSMGRLVSQGHHTNRLTAWSSRGHRCPIQRILRALDVSPWCEFTNFMCSFFTGVEGFSLLRWPISLSWKNRQLMTTELERKADILRNISRYYQAAFDMLPYGSGLD